MLEGSRYRRPIARDDKPLAPKDERKEEEKLRKIGARAVIDTISFGAFLVRLGQRCAH